MKHQQAIDSIWPLLDRPLWIVTASTNQERGGLIATWITQSSLSPQSPQIAAGIAPNHFTRQLIDESGQLGLHLVRANQLDLVERFAVGSGRERDKLSGLNLQADRSAPILTDCLAWMECEVFMRLDAGDRVFFWADVVAGESAANADRADVLRESHLGQLPPEVRAALKTDRNRDIDLQRPLANDFRAQVPELLRPISTP